MSENNQKNKPKTTQSLYVKREKIHARRVKGFFQNIRVVTIWLTLSWFFVAPWLTWNGRQAFLFDLPKRQFHILGVTFWPQDFILLASLMLVAALGLFFVTTVSGRLWCGYTCPQTVWTRFFMYIERLTEGDRLQRIKLDKAPWGMHKILKRGGKHLLWFTLAFATAFTFVGYFTPIKTLQYNFLTFQLGPWESFWMVFFAVATYVNAGWMREQICLYVCPYAKFQSVMLDDNTLVISYDIKRGEPRGSRQRGADYKSMGLGDCINCTKCVQVCPTGIDIRNGLQIECISCAACIDACDEVMEQMNYPKGLVRYTTNNALEGKESRIVRLKSVAYGLLLLMFVSFFMSSLVNRIPLEVDIIRDRNALYRETEDGNVENVYTLKIMNKSQQSHTYKVSVGGLDNVKLVGKTKVHVEAGEIYTLPLRLQSKFAISEKAHQGVFFVIMAVDVPGHIVLKETKFFSPTSYSE